MHDCEACFREAPLLAAEPAMPTLGIASLFWSRFCFAAPQEKAVCILLCAFQASWLESCLWHFGWSGRNTWEQNVVSSWSRGSQSKQERPCLRSRHALRATGSEIVNQAVLLSPAIGGAGHDLRYGRTGIELLMRRGYCNRQCRGWKEKGFGGGEMQQSAYAQDPPGPVAGGSARDMVQVKLGHAECSLAEVATFQDAALTTSFSNMAARGYAGHRGSSRSHPQELPLEGSRRSGLDTMHSMGDALNEP